MTNFRTILALCAVIVSAAANASAQSGVLRSEDSAAARSHDAPPPTQVQSDQTLEIAPRIVAPPPSEQAPAGANESTQPENATPNDAANPTYKMDDSGLAAIPDHKRPYLGASVQYIVSREQQGHTVRGLEIVAVDPQSPAERAGLHGRGTMTKLGASGITAGALMPPLDLFVKPWLERSGQLGQGGDLVVAIDDKRVDSELDLQNELDTLKPRDTIYFTVVRPLQDGSHQTLKIPVKLGEPSQAVANAAAGGAGDNPPSGVNTPAIAASPANPR